MQEMLRLKNHLNLDAGTLSYNKALEINYKEFRMQERDYTPVSLNKDGTYWQG